MSGHVEQASRFARLKGSIRPPRSLHLGLLLWTAIGLSAQHAAGFELTSADRLALLYSSQLQFSVEGDPMIKIGLAEGLEAVEILPEVPIQVQPLGEGGPQVTLPANRRYRVEVVEGEAGTYRYWAVVARLSPGDRARASELTALWSERSYALETFELGSFYAIEGTIFDNRQTLLAAGGTPDRASALDLARRLEADYGLPVDLHVDLVSYPTGTLLLSSDELSVTVSHRDILSLSLMATAGEEARLRIDGRAFGSEGDPETPEDRYFVGTLTFTLDRAGQLAVVNELPLERLLEGILPVEIYASAPLDALKAQAVAARGELIADLGVRHLADPYITCADTRCQVYRGVGPEDARTSNAVADSRGEVLLVDNRIARTVYSASCGGSLGDYHSTWGGPPIEHLQAHLDTLHPPAAFAEGVDEGNLERFLEDPPDSFDNIEGYGGQRLFRWEVELDAEALTEAVGERYAVGRVEDLEVLERDRSGRVVRLRIVGEDGTAVVERELPIRRALGGLRSALFMLDVSESGGRLQGVRIRGAGFGHGVGLCQLGAIGAAQRHLDYLEILSHYYPGTSVRQIWH
jgi:SpoIID/LytB domain protein